MIGRNNFSPSDILFHIYDMGNQALVSEQENIVNGVDIVDMSIAGTIATKRRGLTMAQERRGRAVPMLFDPNLSPYLRVQNYSHRDAGGERNFIDPFLDEMTLKEVLDQLAEGVIIRTIFFQ